VNGLLLFSAADGGRGAELWRSDGTPAGTQLVRDIWPGADGSTPNALVAVDGITLFRANDGTNGIELWRSDGTTAGTTMVANLDGGSASSTSSLAIVRAGSGSRVLFVANDGQTGLELWQSDGTAATTLRLTDLDPGFLGSNPSWLTRCADKVFFSAEDSLHGVEPYVLPLATLGQPLVETFGLACPGTDGLRPRIGASGLPTLGNAAYGATLSDARPSTAATIFLGFAPTSLPIGGGCTLWVAGPPIALNTATTPAGTATMPLSVPNNPRLIGLMLFGQWAILDPNGAWLGIVSLSGALRYVVGL